MSKASFLTRCATLVCWACLLALMAGGRPRSLEAQQPSGIVPNAPCPPEGCITGVTVTPDGGTITLAPNTGSVAHFLARNTGNVSTPFTFTCIASGITCGTVTPASFTIAAGASLEVDAQFTSGTGAGKVTLKATNGGTATDQGFYTVTVVVVGPPAAVAFRNQNGDNIDRGACLTSGAGEAAAFSCGDLAVTHAMPGFTTKNRTRNLTLIYNSAQALPQPLVAVAVNESGVSAPATVYAELKVNGAVKAVNTYLGWGTAPTTRQLTLSYDASADSSGIYPFTFEVRNQYTGGGAFSDTLSGNLVVVNRSQSRYGRGWRPAGIEELRLAQPGGAILWIGGDGSAKVYSQIVAGSKWLAAPGGFRDTLVLTGSKYTRTLRHGIKVVFDAQGRHIQTINRTNDTTFFSYNAYGQVTTIAVPPGGAGNTYTFTWGTSDSLLDKITDPGNRVLNLTVNTANRFLTTAVDPDLVSTSFGYDISGRMTSRTGRRGFRTAYSYAHGLRLTRVAEPIATGDSAITAFSPWDELGLQNLTPTDTAQVYTLIQGPRDTIPDDAKITVDRWGSPTRIVDPIGAVTTMVRGDPKVPLMVTQVTFPKPAGAGPGRIARMTYDSLANLTQVRDSTSHLGAAGMATKVTRYTYRSANQRFSPDSVIDSVAGAARVTRYAYTSQGLTDSVIDARGHRTKFGYTSDGLVNKVTERQVETWHEGVASDTTATKQDLIWAFDFDAQRNLKADTNAAKVVHAYVRDTFGRVTDSYDPLSTRTQFLYDPMDRDTVVRKYTTAQTFPYGINPLLSTRCDATQVVCAQTSIPSTGLPATLDARKRYGPGTLDTLADSRNVRRDFSYDARSLMTKERDDFAVGQLSFIGKSGLLDSTILRSSAHVTYAYDLAGRRVMMRFPSNVYTVTASDGTIVQSTVPGDSIRYSYDTLGNRLTATSQNEGSVTRVYFANGLLKSKTSNRGFTDVISYSYNEAWELTRTIHNGDTTDYAYNATTGDLTSVTVRIGVTGTAAARTRTFSYLWDGMGRLRQITYPGATTPMIVTYRYDAMGVLRRLKSVNPATGSDNFDLTLRNKSVDASGRILSQDMICPGGSTLPIGNPCGTVNNRSDSVGTANGYDQLGQLVRQNRNGWSDTLRYDASGNLSFKWDGQLGVGDHYTMGTGHNQVSRDSSTAVPIVNLMYDANGGRVTEKGTAFAQEKHYYYDALGRMTGTFHWVSTFIHNNPNDCKYDAEGRMAAGCEGAPWLGFDGDNVSGVLFNGGKGWTFFHGPGLDSPLMGYFRNTQVAGPARLLYWLTDGAGRQLAVSDSTGKRQASDQSTDTGTWPQAGGISNSYSFSNSRQENGNLPTLSFYRNRVYDQNTGRWLQEDPMGVAGGLNLYQFNGNNPVSYTDPFGLRIEYEGSAEERMYLAHAMADVKRNLARRAKKSKAAAEMLAGIEEMEQSEDYTVTIGPGNVTTGDYGETSANGLNIKIDFAYGAKTPENFYTPAVLGHELGHAYTQVAKGLNGLVLRSKMTVNGVIWGNTYREAMGMCQQPMNHQAVRLYPSASGSCSP